MAKEKNSSKARKTAESAAGAGVDSAANVGDAAAAGPERASRRAGSDSDRYQSLAMEAARVAGIELDDDAADEVEPPLPAANPSLRELEDQFIESWGDVGGLWGVNRSISRIHALLFISQQPLPMEQISARLQISHGNTSTSIRDLMAWGVVRKVHVTGERKAMYEAEQEPWTWFHTCIRERRRREIMPVVARLQDVKTEARTREKRAAARDRDDHARVRERIEHFTKFLDEFLVLIDAYLAVGHGPLTKGMITLARLMPKGRLKD